MGLTEVDGNPARAARARASLVSPQSRTPSTPRTPAVLASALPGSGDAFGARACPVLVCASGGR
eukprot:13484992-Alexandrium_andersonii.AAC.1